MFMPAKKTSKMLSIRNKIIRKLSHTDTSQAAKKNLRKVNRRSVKKQQVKCERHWNGTDCRFFICDFKLL